MITPTCPLGLVITDPHLPTSQLLDYIEQVRPAAVCVVESARLVHQLCDRYPDMITIARHYWPQDGDDNAHIKTTGDIWALECDRWLGGDTRPWLYWNNEPTTNSPRLVTETLTAYEEASKRGYRVVGPNWGTRWPSNKNLPYFEPVYRAAAIHGHRIGIHAYGGRTMYPDVVFIGDKAWHIGRAWYADRIEGMLAIEPDLRFAITETGLDNILQIPGSGPYRDHGLAGHVYAQQLAHAWENYWQDLPVDFGLVFSWGEGRWQQYSVRGEYLFARELANHNWQDLPAPPPPPEPDPEPEPEPDPQPEPPADDPPGQDDDIGDDMPDIGMLTLDNLSEMTRDQLVDTLAALIGAQSRGDLAAQIARLYVEGAPTPGPAPDPEPGPAPDPDPQPGPGENLLYNVRIDKLANDDRSSWHGEYPRIFVAGWKVVALSGDVGGYTVPENPEFLAEPKTTTGETPTNHAEGWRNFDRRCQEMKYEAGRGGLRMENLFPVQVIAGAPVEISAKFWPFLFAAAPDPEDNPPPADNGVYDSKRVDVDTNLREDWAQVAHFRLVAVDADTGSYRYEGEWHDGQTVFAHTGRLSWRAFTDSLIGISEQWIPSTAGNVHFGFEVILHEELALQSIWLHVLKAIQ